MTTTDDLVTEIRRLDEDLRQLPARPLTTAHARLYAELLQTLAAGPREATVCERILADPAITALRGGLQQRFARAAFDYEWLWSRAIAATERPVSRLRADYPFHSHYQRATALEYRAVSTLAADTRIRRILVAGCGPLPSTAIELAEHTDASINAIDIDGDAVAAAQTVIERLALAEQVRIRRADIAACVDLERYDAVWLGALIGDETSKQHLVGHVAAAMAPGALLLARTASGLRQLLYARVEPTDLAPLQPLLRLEPFAHNYHASLIAQAARTDSAAPSQRPSRLDLPEATQTTTPEIE